MKKMNNRAEREIMQFFSSMADETRLKILLCLAEGEKTVGSIHKCIGKDKMTLSAISHQLRLLNDNRIVSSRKQGKEKYFRLGDDFCWCILKEACSHFGKEKKIKCSKCLKIKNGEII